MELISEYLKQQEGKPKGLLRQYVSFHNTAEAAQPLPIYTVGSTQPGRNPSAETGPAFITITDKKKEALKIKLDKQREHFILAAIFSTAAILTTGIAYYLGGVFAWQFFTGGLAGLVLFYCRFLSTKWKLENYDREFQRELMASMNSGPAIITTPEESIEMIRSDNRQIRTEMDDLNEQIEGFLRSQSVSIRPFATRTVRR